MTIKVIGAGFGRTGTASLKRALEELGFRKCYHMEELFQQPKDALVWDAAAMGQAVDWDALFTGYQATVDWPGCTFYHELMQQYPEAKVILSVRDPEKWYASAMQTIYRVTRMFPLPYLRRVVPRLRRVMRMQDHVFWQGTFHGRFADKTYAIEVFNRHNEEVKRFVPPERLLVYEVTQGWEPLCRFLDVPVPHDRPFPHVNDTATWQRRFALVRRATQVSAVISVSALLVAGWYLWQRGTTLPVHIATGRRHSDG